MFLTPDLIKSVLHAELIYKYRAKIDISKDKFCICHKKVGKGDIFITAGTKKENYYSQIEESYLKGASAIITTKGTACPELPIPIIKVENPVKAMEKLAAILIRNYQPIIIAITGNNGKTTTKELLMTLLKNYGKTHCNQDNANSILDLILAILNANFTCKFLVLEVGICNLGDMDLFNQITLPNVGIITNVGFAPIKALESIEKTAIEKAKIFQNGCTAILNLDTSCSEVLCNEAKKSNAPIISFGKGATCDIQLLDYSNNIASVRVGDTEYCYTFPNHGIHFIYDTLASIGAIKALKLKITSKMLNNAFFGFQPKKGRGEAHDCCINGKNIRVIDYSYKANYESTLALINYLQSHYSHLPKIAIIGSVEKAGEKTEELYEELAKNLTAIETVIFVGPEIRNLMKKEAKRSVTLYKNTEELIDYFERDHPFIENSIIAVTGTRHTGLDQFVAFLLEKAKQTDFIHWV